MFAYTVLSPRIGEVPMADQIGLRQLFENIVGQHVATDKILAEMYGNKDAALSKKSPLAQYDNPMIEACWQIMLLSTVTFGYTPGDMAKEVDRLMVKIKTLSYVPHHA